MERIERKEQFIKALAHYLGRDLAVRSIQLQMGQRAAQEWAELWAASGLFGWKSEVEIEAELRELLM